MTKEYRKRAQAHIAAAQDQLGLFGGLHGMAPEPKLELLSRVFCHLRKAEKYVGLGETWGA